MIDNSSGKENEIKLLSFDIDNTLIDFFTFKSNFPKVWIK
jgi:FMN phosphatase YigB (HAD superfamily)